MTGVARITKLDFFIMKSQGISYLSLVAVILLFGLMGSSITVLCITGAWFIALMATNIFAIQEKNHLDRLYGSVCVSLNEVVLGRYTFTLQIVLMKIQGYSTHEIARYLKITEKAVYRHMDRLKEKVKKIFE